MAQASEFQRFFITNEWPSCWVGARADWSSDIGPDYLYYLGPDPNGNLKGFGEGTASFSRPTKSYDSGVSYSFRLKSREDAAGNTFSGGNASIPTVDGTVNPNKVFKFHMYSHLAENSPGMGISTESSSYQGFEILGDYIGQPKYWAMEWTAVVEGTGSNITDIGLSGCEGSIRHGIGPGRTIYSGTSGNRYVIRGSDHGVQTGYCFPGYFQSYSGISIYTSVKDYAGAPGTGDANITVRVVLSDNPIYEVPGETAYVVQNPLGELLNIHAVGGIVDQTTSLGTPPAGAKTYAASDFDGNGTADLVLGYDPDGAGVKPYGIYLWRFLGDALLDKTRIALSTGDFSEPAGSSDLDADRIREILMRNPANNRFRSFEISPTAPYGFGERITVPVSGLFTELVGVYDMDGDGSDDFVLRNPANGWLRYRYLTSGVTKSFSLPLKTLGDTVNLAGICQGSQFLVESPDGIAPRQLWNMDDTVRTSVGSIVGDLYASSPIVAISK